MRAGEAVRHFIRGEPRPGTGDIRTLAPYFPLRTASEACTECCTWVFVGGLAWTDDCRICPLCIDGIPDCGESGEGTATEGAVPFK